MTNPGWRSKCFQWSCYLLELGSIGGPQQFDRVTISLDTTGGPEVFDDLRFNSVATVPEPEIYAMMGVGLGILSWVRRKKSKESATRPI